MFEEKEWEKKRVRENLVKCIYHAILLVVSFFVVIFFYELPLVDIIWYLFMTNHVQKYKWPWDDEIYYVLCNSAGNILYTMWFFFYFDSCTGLFFLMAFICFIKGMTYVVMKQTLINIQMTIKFFSSTADSIWPCTWLKY